MFYFCFLGLQASIGDFFFFAAGGLSYSLNVNFSFLPAVPNSSSFSFHLSPCFATCIQVWLFFTSLPFVASVSSGLKQSFTSSSDLFLSLPTALHVLILVLNPGFQFSSFPYPSFFWWRCYSHRQSSFHSWPPSFNLFVWVFCKGDVAILVAIGVSATSFLCFAFGVLLAFFSFATSLFRFSCCSPSSFLYFLLVCTMSRSIFRFAYSINLSCSFVKVHVPHA